MPKKTMKEENKAKKDKKHYFKDFKTELKKVIWPTPKQLINNTVTVIVMVLITAAIVFALDFVFESLNEYGIEKLKTVVSNEQNNQESTEGQDTENQSEETNNTVDSNNEVANENDLDANANTTVE